MDEKPKPKEIRFIRKVRPRYHKLLIPALIISLIIAVILILIVRKYLVEPLLENQGLLEASQSVVLTQTGNPQKQGNAAIFAISANNQSLARQWRRET